MSAQQYDRAFKLTVDGQTVAEQAGDPDNSLRVRFHLETLTNQTPNHIRIVISNLSQQTSDNLVEKVKAKAELTLEAGYVGSSGLIFKGDLWYCIAGRESPTDTTLQLYARDGGLGYDYGVISKALAKGSTPKDHFDAFADALAPFGITKGYVPDLSTPTYPRGVSLFGMVKDGLRVLSESTGSTWSIQNKQLQMVPAGSGVPGNALDLNAANGLIGMPAQNPEGIMVRCLINPAINLGSGNTIHLNNADIQKSTLSPAYGSEAQNNDILSNINKDGLYRIYHIEANGDSRGGDWYQDLTCFNKDLPPANIPQQYLVTPPDA